MKEQAMQDRFYAKEQAEQHLHDSADRVAAGIVEEYFIDRPGLAERIERQDAVVYILDDAAGGKKVLRLSSNPHWRADSTADAYQKWQALGVPVPRTFAHGQAEQLQYLLMEYIDSEVFDFTGSHQVQLQVMGNMGSLLARMRSVESSGYGYLDADGRGVFQAWHDFLAFRYMPGWTADNKHLSSEEVSKIKTFIDSLAREPIASVLLNGDFKPKNMFVTKTGEIAAVADPQTLAGDALWDIAIFNHFVYREQARQSREFHDKEFQALRDAFMEGYTDTLGRDLSKDERARIAGYEKLIDAEKVEKLLRKDRSLDEGSCILSYLHKKLGS